MKKLKTLELKGGKEVDVFHTATQWSIGWKDAIVGLLMAVGTAVGPYIYDAIMAWFNYQEPDFDWRTCLKFAFSAAIVYLTRKYFQKDRIVIKTEELTKRS